MNVMALLLWPSKCRLHLLKGLLLPLLRSRFVYMLLIIMRRVELSKAERIKSETSCPVCDNYLDSFLQTFKLVHGSSNQLHSALYGPYSLMISTNHQSGFFLKSNSCIAQQLTGLHGPLFLYRHVVF